MRVIIKPIKSFFLKKQKSIAERAKIDIQPVLFLGCVFVFSISLSLSAEVVKVFAGSKATPLIAKLQIVILVFGALLSFSGYVRTYLSKIYDIAYGIQEKMTKGSFGIDTRDNIYRMMVTSFKKSVDSNHEICVTSFVKHNPTVITDAMREYHSSTKPLIMSGDAVVKRIVVVEDINKLRWIEEQIQEYTDNCQDFNHTGEISMAPSKWPFRMLRKLSLHRSNSRGVQKNCGSQFRKPNAKSTRISLRILTPELRYTNQWLMPINLELFGGEDVYIINPTMRGNETPYDVCSYFLGNQENYSIYRALFQNIWTSSEEVIENGTFKENAYRKIKQVLMRNFVHNIIFDAGQSFPRSSKHIERELDRMDLDPRLLQSFWAEAAISRCSSFREINLTQGGDNFEILFQWWNKDATKAYSESGEEDLWIKCISGAIKIKNSSNQEIGFVEPGFEVVGRGRAKYIAKSSQSFEIISDSSESTITVVVRRVSSSC